MKIVIAGGTGFIGSAVARRLSSRGEVVVLSRRPELVRVGRGVSWNPSGPGAWQQEVDSADVVINLAGENISEGRWTAERKQQLVESRLQATGALVNALRKAPSKERTFISASAIGFYGPHGDESLDEASAAGADFLATLTERWEAAAKEAEGSARLVILRIGVVVGPNGGAVQKMLLPFRLFAGGPTGSGRQWMSWIALDDLVGLIEWAIDHPAARGIYNATAPNPVTNRTFVSELGKALHRPAILPTPPLALKLLFGEMADAILLKGQKVLPRRAVAEGFQFGYPEAGRAIQAAVEA